MAEDLPTSLRKPGTVLLDTSRPDGESRHCYLFTEPVEVLATRRLDAVERLLRRMDEVVASGYYAAGFVAYEAGRAIVLGEREGSSSAGWPLVWVGVYEKPHVLTPRQVDAYLSDEERPWHVESVRFDIKKQAYLQALGRIKHHVREGDVYQINFTDAVTFDFDGSALAFYSRLRNQQRVGYGAYLQLEDGQLLSCSPELFFRRAGRRIWTRPMKGTIRRGRTVEEDRRLAEELTSDAKGQAENLMIVDLLRNDLSRCCEPGSVRVPSLFEAECYESVIQMTSTVEGRLEDSASYPDIFGALFPCGSVTGAPKRRAMRIIQDLERGPRGPYCGAVGYAAPDEEAVFNVAIRTVALQDGQGRMGVGSGIVWDSVPEAEYEECLLKAHFLTANDRHAKDFKLIETMRWHDGTVANMCYHLERLQESARYFRFPLDAAAFRHQVEQKAQGLPEESTYKVRVTLDRYGHLEVTTEEAPPADETPLRLTVAGRPQSSENVFLYHKTTNRDFYERPYREAQSAGYDEVLFVNERGEVTEGSRSNVFVQCADGLVTPPVMCGLLNGTYRRHLLDARGDTAERVIRLDDLRRAEAVYVCNALRGLRRGILEDE